MGKQGEEVIVAPFECPTEVEEELDWWLALWSPAQSERWELQQQQQQQQQRVCVCVCVCVSCSLQAQGWANALESNRLDLIQAMEWLPALSSGPAARVVWGFQGTHRGLCLGQSKSGLSVSALLVEDFSLKRCCKYGAPSVEQWDQ